MAENAGEIAVEQNGGVCPKCGTAVEASTIACAKCGTQIQKAAAKVVKLTTGQKIAAVVLILNGIAVIAEMFIMKGSEGASSSAKGALVSIFLGAYMFTGKKIAVDFAKWAAIIGGVLYTVVYIFAQHDIFMAVIQVLFSLSLVALLFGKAGIVRIVLACIILFGYFGLETLGLLFPDAGSETVAAEEPAPQGK